MSSLVFLMLLVVPSNGKKTDETDTTYMKFSSNDNHCSNDSNCPTWFTCNAEYRCQCESRHTNKIVCDNEAQISAVLNCNCVTYDSESKSTYIGACFYNCLDTASSLPSDLFIRKLPKNPETLINNSACTYFHRTGLLCGDCEERYSPLVLSYNLSCVECPNGLKNWWKFILVGFVPLTIIYILIITFNINVTSSRLRGVVWYSQFMSMPVLVRTVLLTCSIKEMKYLNIVKIGSLFYSLWNLELFRSVLPNICLNVTTIQALSLEYLIALYPFVLILFSYFLIILYDKRVPVVVTMWKPYNKVLTIFQKSWNIRTSVLDSFATFFLLSYSKVLSVTIDLLIPTQIAPLTHISFLIGSWLLSRIKIRIPKLPFL